MSGLRYSPLMEATRPRPDATPPTAPTPVEPAATFIVHLTNFAPGCALVEMDDRRRNRTFWNRPLDAVLRATLTRLDRAPEEVRVAETGDSYLGTSAASDIAAAEIPLTVGKDEAHLVGRVEPFGEVPLAAFWDGATAEALRAALQALASAGWRPTRNTLPNIED